VGHSVGQKHTTLPALPIAFGRHYSLAIFPITGLLVFITTAILSPAAHHRPLFRPYCLSQTKKRLEIKLSTATSNLAACHISSTSGRRTLYGIMQYVQQNMNICNIEMIIGAYNTTSNYYRTSLAVMIAFAA
jgi:hypothetical protein